MIHQLVTFADQSSAARTMPSLGALIDKVVQSVGFEYFALFRRTDLKSSREEDHYCGNIPAAYAEQIREEGLHMACAPNQASRVSLTGVCWRGLHRRMQFTPKHTEIEARARTYGLVGGFTLSLRIPSEPDGIFSVARPDDIETTESERVALRSIAATALENAIRIARSGQETAVPMLGRRQLECTELVAQGKTDWEIAQILGVGRDTVHEYVEAARKRYGVRTRTQLVVEAIRTGQLAVEDLPR